MLTQLLPEERERATMGTRLPQAATSGFSKLSYVGIFVLLVHAFSSYSIHSTAKRTLTSGVESERWLDEVQRPQPSHNDPYAHSVKTMTISSKQKQSPVGERENATAIETSNRNGWRPSLQWADKCARDASKYAAKPFEVQWVDYTLGDCVKMCYKCAKSARRSHNKYKSFAGQYYKQACHGIDETNFTLGNNFTFLERLLQKHENDPSFVKPADDELVIHLRLGDVIEYSNSSARRMLYEGAVPHHNAKAFKSFKSIKSASEILDDIEESGMSKVTIRGGSHYPDKFKKSRVYATCLKEAIAKAGYPVTMTIEKDSTPDQDFYFMVHAKRISLSTGGYSRLIGQMAQQLGGKVVGREL